VTRWSVGYAADRVLFYGTGGERGRQYLGWRKRPFAACHPIWLGRRRWLGGGVRPRGLSIVDLQNGACNVGSECGFPAPTNRARRVEFQKLSQALGQNWLEFSFMAPKLISTGLGLRKASVYRGPDNEARHVEIAGRSGGSLGGI